ILDEVRGFVTLGNKVDGWPGVCHGGVVAAILDEVPSMLTRVNAPGRSFMTAYLNVTYLGPVRTPGTIMVVSRLKRVQGRKVYVESVVEDENGEKLAKADTLFVETRAML
ncbi:HotDog domain-containing protein, partial [Diaporthe sp. PMI_573]